MKKHTPGTPVAFWLGFPRSLSQTHGSVFAMLLLGSGAFGGRYNGNPSIFRLWVASGYDGDAYVRVKLHYHLPCDGSGSLPSYRAEWYDEMTVKSVPAYLLGSNASRRASIAPLRSGMCHRLIFCARRDWNGLIFFVLGWCLLHVVRTFRYQPYTNAQPELQHTGEFCNVTGGAASVDITVSAVKGGGDVQLMLSTTEQPSFVEAPFL
jgi:hypothetical protein